MWHTGCVGGTLNSSEHVKVSVVIINQKNYQNVFLIEIKLNKIKHNYMKNLNLSDEI